MPSYILRQHDNGAFYIHWTEGRRSRRRSTGTESEAEAQVFLARWILSDQQEAETGAPSYTVGELWAAYYERHVEKNNVETRPADTAWKNLSQHFAALTLADFAKKDASGADAVERYVALRAAGKIGRCKAAPATIRHEVTLLRAALNWCAKPKVAIIPAALIPVFDIPPDSDPRDRWLRVDEIQALFAAAAALRSGPRLSRGERFLWLALETAARLQAILDLTWDRVDFETGMVHYNVPGRRKTKKRRVSVPISKALRPVLLRAHDEREGDLVMDNKVLTIWRATQAIAKHAGVERVSPHVLRHTAATHMLRRGVPIWTVAGVLGNTVALVEKVYGHHCREGLAGGVEMISGGLLELAE
ncbi:tyrosine-type recombinase/integrase [Rhodopseudomonas pseudopalustris]|uniref:Site-specific recombinase XerD n=1 Tax=Rhodopseudomonas pseudopalustris TaxID=1513892 RepID=A0A1H8WIA5_9BRAD|nr:site-specific integrase [Rhodopseudomonas pseudopalustris]SEP26818.1 Site-specific recombinase XerD [Rhodopseudomonas pseudopalustris]